MSKAFSPEPETSAEELERAGPQLPSLGRSWRRGLDWVFPMPRGECPPVIYTDIYRKHTGLLIHKIEEQSVFSLAGLLGSVADLNHFRTCPDLPSGRRPRLHGNWLQMELPQCRLPAPCRAGATLS